MRFVKSFFGFFLSRLFWTMVGITLLCVLIWMFGPLLSFGAATPLGSELARLITIGLIIVFWLLMMLIRQIRAARANRMFVTELAASEPDTPLAPGTENVAEVNQKFQDILTQMKRSKLGGRKFLRDMPWYVIIGPPGTGKTTALKQSGLHFPIDLSDDIKGVGGTRNCDWFFTEDAVLIDTAGRYVQQESDPEVDAAEWQGFLGLLTRHRGRRALNGIILTLSVEELLGDEAALREHGREIRKRLAELREKLEIQLPVYLMITKVDLVPGFESFFGDFGTRAREQVWGATLPTEARVDGTMIEREVKALLHELEERMPRRIAADLPLSERGEVFRFPAQVDRLTQPLKALIDTVFGESRYEESPWLRGFYLTSATQEGSPIDQLVGSLAGSFGLEPPGRDTRGYGEKRSFFLRNLLTEVIFPEAGLGTFDPRAEERRRWIFRGTLAGASLISIVAILFFLFSFQRYSGGIADQERQLTALSARLANVAARQAPTDPLDLPLALDAATEVDRAGTEVKTGVLTFFGPTAEAELAHAQTLASNHVLRNILEPRMVALLEATMWRRIRDPEYLLGALKTYQMMTGLAPYDASYIESWWLEKLPEHAPIDPFPTEAAALHQIAAIQRMELEEDRIEPDPALLAEALPVVCDVPLSKRAFDGLMAHPDVTALPDWIPAEHAGPNGTRVFTRVSEKTLRQGLPGAFTFEGFHKTVLPLVPEIAAQAALDRAVFAGGCADSSETTETLLQQDVLKLYYEDFITQWDGLLRDIRLAPINDLNTATINLKDLSSTDSALKRLLRAVVAETYLTKPEDAGGGGNQAAQKGILKIAQKKLGKVGKLAKKSSKFVKPGGGAAQALPGDPVAEHFKPIRGMIEDIDGVPAMIGDVEAALTTLLNQLQTILANPNRQQQFVEQNAMAELLGSVTNVAAVLPDPIDDWVTALSQEIGQQAVSQVIAQMNARWRADILPFCTAATRGRYPFDQSSSIDVNTVDFARLFGPGGLIDTFTNDFLLQYTDINVRPWRWRADIGLEDAALQPFENARAIRDALFPGGAGPVMSFTLEPRDLSANASRVTLNVDGQNLSYFNSATRPMPMTWPGTDGTNMITLSFAPVDGSAEVITSEIGGWALLRLLRKGRLSPTSLPEVFRLRLGAQNYVAEFELRANSVENPFDLTMFSGFTCPQGF